MLFNKINISNRLRQALLVLVVLLNTVSIRAQTYVTGTLNTGTLPPGQYYNNTTISFGPGFAASGSTGNYRFYINADCIPLATAPTGSQNYVMTSVPRIAGYVPGTAGYSSCDVMQTIQYIDGLGRPVQTVQVKGSPKGADLVQPQAYDPFGRETTKYLPYAYQGTADGSYKSDALGTTTTSQYGFYNNPPAGVGTIPYPAAVTLIEPSPLNRPVEQGAPGAAWQPYNAAITGSGHTQKIAYLFNNSTAWATDSVNSRAVSFYNAAVNSNQSRTLAVNGYYPAGQLSVTVTKDENWVSGRAGTTEEYKDKDGRVVLKRVYNYSGTLQVLSTYYVYDDKDELAFVLPPASGADAAGSITQTVLDNLCYQYRYDERGRLAQKKIPGKGWDNMVYNILDQQVAAQDSMQRVAGQWIYTKYDGTGRVITTGVLSSSSTRAALQSTVSAITANLWETPVSSGTGYTGNAWPTGGTNPLSIMYYDGYNLIPSLPAAYSIPAGGSGMTRGLATAGKTMVLNTIGNATPDMLWTTEYYDDLGRSIKSYKQHYKGGSAALSTGNYDAVSTAYNFTNAPTTTTRQHYLAGTLSITVANQYGYDHMGRKLTNWQQIINGTTPTTRTLLSQMTYNEIGQPLNKQQHSVDSTTFLQNIAYTYNERDWLSQSSSALFAMQLKYNDGTAPQYNGNIANQYWGTPGSLTNNYIYRYDKINRLLSGIASTGNTEKSITYDNMGNITGLQRYLSSTEVDGLKYSYTDGSGNQTNRLYTITDSTGNDAGLKHGTFTYAYDGNGNMVTDNSKGLNTTYNLLNLPLVNTLSAGTVTYTYDAGGKKLRKVSTVGSGSTIDYVDGIQYNTAGTIDFIQTEEGRALPSGSSSYNYEYNLSDHLGDTRLTYSTLTGAATTVQQDDYMPFGMDLSIGTVTNPQNYYLYNKKELQPELGLYDYGARLYDPVIGRWTSVDPLAELGRRWSPYNYGMDNPLKYIDPDGMWTETANGYTSDNAEEAQAMFRELQASVARLQPPKKKPATSNNNTSKTDALKTVSKVPKKVKKPKDFSPPVNPDQSYITAWPPPEEVNYQDLGLATTSQAIGSNIITGYSAIEGGFLFKSLFSTTKAGVTVLGKFPTYLELAEELGANRFSLPSSVYNEMTESEQWAANLKFLDETIARGDKIVLSNPVMNINEISGAFRKELEYLVSKGYSLSSDGTQMIK